jgi:hypothetical protein
MPVPLILLLSFTAVAAFTLSGATRCFSLGGFRRAAPPIAKNLSHRTYRLSDCRCPQRSGIRWRQVAVALRTLDYPKELLQVIVVSDGSTDETEAIVREWADRGVVTLKPCRAEARSRH